MAIFRLILLVALLGGLALLLAQNWSPVLPLVFLGMQTQALPLAMWILFSTAAGAATSLAISILFQLSSYFTAPKRQVSPASKPPRTRTPFDSDRPRTEEPKYSYTSPPPSASETADSTRASAEDWETSSINDDWDFDETEETAKSPQNTHFRDSDTYEKQQEPKSGSKSGSVYSYNYREPKNSGAGKTESVYDADYRVIVPPYQPPTDNQADGDEDDWGFLDDDNENEDERPRR
ncbi:LapA family protein [Chlorogloeopsis sp. ULAP01]|uniref:LapA family protein n=1 Tax=Chlorogloeopsis sp. ULAP01 TaxID=3056483 RepID=UPI0025AB1E45|nr:LapA family protein [Chlorogloeopsis sp. ULAP01]MDM9385250.1 LapA family protein [Chlorogloeopsis sp. ULAP01]